MDDYTQLTPRERRRIGCFLDMNLSIDAISERLGRHRSTIYREIKRNSIKGCYLPGQANEKAKKRKFRKPYKFKVNKNIYDYVINKLKKGWSPEQICGRLKFKKHAESICPETLYQYIYKHSKGALYQYLPTQRKKRIARYQRKARPKPCTNHKSILNRPIEAENRLNKGHWEGDTIRFTHCRIRSVTTLVERKSRLLLLCKNDKSTSELVMNNLKNKMKCFTKNSYQTLTFDQGSEFTSFYSLEQELKCTIFYAQARSPWQRGTNENTNGRIRRYIPRNINPANMEQNWLDEIANLLNNTPRKCLGFRTPREVFLKGEI